MALRKQAETEKAIQLCDERCVVCGWNCKSLQGKPLVVGAHIKPIKELYKDSFDDIIALCPNHHAEFDAYKFCIDADTLTLVYAGQNSSYHQQPVVIPYVRKEYIAYRQYLFKKVHQDVDIHALALK